MGLEADCEVRQGRNSSNGRAQLEPSELRFRSTELRLRIALKDVNSVEAGQGELRVTWSEGAATFLLGSAAVAEKWALKIRYPRGLMDKLGVKPGSVVSVIRVVDASFRAELDTRTPNVTGGKPARDSDLVVVGMTSRAELPQLRKLRAAIKKSGAIWVVWPKGRKELREDDVRAYGARVGLVDVKVVSVSQTLSGLKLVIPVSQR